MRGGTLRSCATAARLKLIIGHVLLNFSSQVNNAPVGHVRRLILNLNLKNSQHYSQALVVSESGANENCALYSRLSWLLLKKKYCFLKFTYHQCD